MRLRCKYNVGMYELVGEVFCTASDGIEGIVLAATIEFVVEF